jgi:transcriptional regulator with XRE-family HTH domain
MTLGERIKRLRQERNWSQVQFAERLNVHQKQVSGYERGVHSPSVEVLIRMAELLDVSLDYLAFENRENAPIAQIADRDLLLKMEEVDKLPEADKTTIKAVLDSFILKFRFQQLAS